MTNKKSFVKYLVLILIVPCILLCSACSISFGRSAYDIAVDNGFVGTEAEWLASLKGTDGTNLTIDDLYQRAVEEGFEGTMLEFINQKLEFSVSSSDELVASKAILSAVKIVCGFTKTITTYDFFGNASTKKNAYTSNGAGVIYELSQTKNRALIVTNYHVVYDKDSDISGHISDNINVYIYGNESTAIVANYIGGSLNHDIAVLSVENSSVLMASDCVAATIANSDEIVVGEKAIAIGNPEAQGISVTSGIVSVDSQNISLTSANGTTKVDMRVIRIDTAINEGNSGGGLFDKNGDLIGIVNAKSMKDSDGNVVENIGYAIPSNVAIRVANAIYQNCYGTSKTGFLNAKLGATLIGTSKAVYDSSTKLTKIVEEVVLESAIAGGVAKKMGLNVGDKISKIKIVDGQNVTEIEITRKFQVDDAMLLINIGSVVTIYSDDMAHLPYTFKSTDFSAVS